MDYIKLARQIHKNNVAKGFWDKKRNEGEVLMLVVSELSESLEGDRKGRYSNQAEFRYLDGLSSVASKKPKSERVKLEQAKLNYFAAHIKDSVGDELADAFIRMLDYYVGLKLKISNKRILSYIELYKKDKMKNFGEELLKLCGIISRIYQGEDKEMLCDYVVAKLICIADQKKINLEKHIEYKMLYNSTRPKMHNKKY
jgi:hypothetical protein